MSVLIVKGGSGRGGGKADGRFEESVLEKCESGPKRVAWTGSKGKQ